MATSNIAQYALEMLVESASKTTEIAKFGYTVLVKKQDPNTTTAFTKGKILLYLRNTTEPLNFMESPFFVEDGGVDISQPQQSTNHSSYSAYSPTYTNFLGYETREVSIKLHLLNFSHSAVKKLFRWVEMLNFTSQMTKEPQLALYVQTTSSNGMYLKVLNATIESDSDLMTVASVYNTSVLGQTLNLSFKCEPFFYKKNPLLSPVFFTRAIIHSDNNIGWSPSTNSAGYTLVGGELKTFYIDGDEVLGDVPSPMYVDINNGTIGGGSDNEYHIGCRYAYPGSGLSLPQDSGETYLVASGSATTTINGEIPFRLTGQSTVIVDLLSTTVVTEDMLIKVELKKDNITTIDTLTYRVVDFNNALAKRSYILGALFIPKPGLSDEDGQYSLVVTLEGVAAVYNISAYLTPSEVFRSYYAESIPNSLIDNPYSGRIDCTNHSLVYAAGSQLFVIPGISAEYTLTTLYDEGRLMDTVYGRLLKVYYNPRYLHLRNT